MRVNLLKKLRRKIHNDLLICRNDSKFTLNWVYLTITFKGCLYKTERKWGSITSSVLNTLRKELEHLVLEDYIIRKRIGL